MKVKILETIDYTLSRKGHRVYTIVDENGRPISKSGCWKSKATCRKHIEELGHEFTGVVTEHKNYQHWASFVPVQ